MANYYEILEVDKNADAETIKKSYRNLARQYHPDGSSEDDAEERMKQLNEAYEVLGNPEKKQQYDMQQENPHMSFNPFGAGFGGFGGFDDLFMSQGFNPFGNRRAPHIRNSDIHLQYPITLEETLNPLSVNFNLERTISCSDCDGKGGHDPRACNDCGGKGVRTTLQQFQGMTMQQSSPCHSCSGTGSKYETQCDKCHGFGLIRETLNKQFNFPLGCLNRRFRFENLGNQEHTSVKPGDVYIDVTLKPHPLYKVEGFAPIYPLGIDPVEFIVGGTHVVKTIDNQELTINIPKGVNQGHREEFKGYGIPVSENDRGPFYVEVFYKNPSDLTSEQEEILKGYLKNRKEVLKNEHD